MLVALKDAWWAIERDRLGMARDVADLMPGRHPELRLDGWWAIQVALASLDRLEVRGRDSAGLHVLVAGHGLDLADPAVRALLGGRAPILCSRRARCALRRLPELRLQGGRRDRRARRQRQGPARGHPRRRAAGPGAGLAESRATVVGHTRWASVGIISEPNAHPLNSEEVDGTAGPLRGRRPQRRRRQPRRSAPGRGPAPAPRDHDRRQGDPHHGVPPAGRGVRHGRRLPRHRGPLRRLGRHRGLDRRRTRRAVPGPVRVGPVALHRPGRGRLRGGQRAYGLVEETPRYVRMDGESTQGQVVALRRDGAGTLGGMRRSRYDGGPLPVDDAGRGHGRDHHERHRPGRLSPLPPQGADRGARLVPQDPARQDRGRRRTGGWASGSARTPCPPALARALAEGSVDRVLVIGQGTAAVAGPGRGGRHRRLLPAVAVTALPATELSGFGLTDDMSDTLVVAISQSGTTTDTNRTVDLARTRGAHVVAIVNRRNSDLAAKAHGVLLHLRRARRGDERGVDEGLLRPGGRRVAAGRRAGRGRVRRAGAPLAGEIDRVLRALRHLPEAMERGAGRPGGDRPHRRVGRPVPALLGGGRQRTGPDRGRRGAHQAVRAVLPVDLQRRHRGQEAHRPVVRAADPGVRGRAARPERRRRGQGGRHLPGPQGGARRGRDRRRGRPLPARPPWRW